MSISVPPSPSDEKQGFHLNLQHGHKDLVQAVAFNTYGDRFATGSVDGKIRVFNRHKDGSWRLCDTWSAHGGEVLEVRQRNPAFRSVADLGAPPVVGRWAESTMLIIRGPNILYSCNGSRLPSTLT
jgi:WD40 repeat protein